MTEPWDRKTRLTRYQIAILSRLPSLYSKEVCLFHTTIILDTSGPKA
jgi:hypothetical protein